MPMRFAVNLQSWPVWRLVMPKSEKVWVYADFLADRVAYIPQGPGWRNQKAKLSITHTDLLRLSQSAHDVRKGLTLRRMLRPSGLPDEAGEAWS